MSKARILVCPVGSAGDVYPLLGLAVALKHRGHDVTVMTSGYFRDTVEREGIDFVDTLSKEDFIKMTNDERLWDPLRGLSTIAKSMRPHLKRGYHQVAELVDPANAGIARNVVALTSCIGFPARLVHDSLQLPLITVDLQPAVLWSAYQTPRIFGALHWSWVPRWIKQAHFRLGERLVLDPLLCPMINELRAELGLAPVRQISDWWHSPQRILGLFPEWYAKPQPDWPPQTRLTQFPLWNEQTDQPLPADVAAFLEAGEPPIVFTPGSANRFGKSFFEASKIACQKMGKRGMFFSKFDDHLPNDLPETVQHFRYAPFATLLPKVAAIVHHGGVGTTAQALAAGIPQLIMPLAHDQMDNAARVERLQVGDSLYPRQYQPPALMQRLDWLLTSPIVAKHCQQVATRFHEVDPLESACQEVERFMEQFMLK